MSFECMNTHFEVNIPELKCSICAGTNDYLFCEDHEFINLITVSKQIDHTLSIFYIPDFDAFIKRATNDATFVSG